MKRKKLPLSFSNFTEVKFDEIVKVFTCEIKSKKTSNHMLKGLYTPIVKIVNPNNVR